MMKDAHILWRSSEPIEYLSSNPVDGAPGAKARFDSLDMARVSPVGVEWAPSQLITP